MASVTTFWDCLILLRSSFSPICLLLLRCCEGFNVAVVADAAVVAIAVVSVLVPLSKLSFLLKRLCSTSSV